VRGGQEIGKEGKGKGERRRGKGTRRKGGEGEERKRDRVDPPRI